MLIKNHGDVTPSINGVKVEKVTEFGIFGVILDENVSWKPHTSYVKSTEAELYFFNDVKYSFFCNVLIML